MSGVPSKPKTHSPRLVSLKNAAREIGIPYSSWRTVVRDERLMVYKFGGRWYVARADLDAFIDRHREHFVERHREQ
jgi:hypothetical protein